MQFIFLRFWISQSIPETLWNSWLGIIEMRKIKLKYSCLILPFKWTKMRSSGRGQVRPRRIYCSRYKGDITWLSLCVCAPLQPYITQVKMYAEPSEQIKGRDTREIYCRGVTGQVKAIHIYTLFLHRQWPCRGLREKSRADSQIASVLRDAEPTRGQFNLESPYMMLRLDSPDK